MKYLFYTFFCLLVVTGIIINQYILYLLFIVMVIYEYWSNRIKRLNDIWIVLAVYSVILPDSYSSEIFFILFCFFGLSSNHISNNTNYKKALYFAAVYVLLNTILNMVPVVNVLFSIISFLPFALFLIMIGKNTKEKYDFIHFFDLILFIEIVATITNFIVFRRISGDDWSCGTLSKSGGQQAQLFVITSFLSILYFFVFREKRKRKDFYKMILSGFLAITTNCWVLLASFFAGLAVSFILSFKLKKMLAIIVVLVLIPFSFKSAFSLFPKTIQHTVNQVLNDSSYFEYRFSKAIIYRNTFVETPSKDIKFALFGCGVGYYNSRAALTCTGEYADFYNTFFKPSMSVYTRNNILKYQVLAKNNGSTDYGSVVARPNSSIISVMGECGYLGLLLFVILIVLFLHNKSHGIKTIIIIWLCYCFFESYFEYPKVLLVMYFCISYIEFGKTPFLIHNRLMNKESECP